MSKCGEKQPTKQALHVHQKECAKCLSMIRSGPSSGKERTMYCGTVVRTKKKASEHYQNCQVCHAKRREIRVETCKKLEHTPAMRQKYSETAKKTSSRPDIQQQRAARLKAWREQNPEAFRKIQSKAHASIKLSKLENWLEPYLNQWGFTRNVQLRCGEKKKQVDFVCKGKKIVIEVDGPWHFFPIRSQKNLENVQQRDRMLDEEILRRAWRMIRLSMQNFKGKSGELFSIKLEELFAMINDETWVGIRCLGSLYEQLSLDTDKVMILK
ncbi:hypothetical protein QUF75_09085, partial [Desulfococcaceae bacterium HSG7]|nr:hypothetical protein [Desulfococcaceae bacterium HSG7]